MLHQSQKSILALKSWLFTPATKSDRFSRAAEVKADALIIALEDAVAPNAKEEARIAALRYLGEISSNHLPCALRINSPDTRYRTAAHRGPLRDRDAMEPYRMVGPGRFRLCPRCAGATDYLYDW